jgi:hypothetical protein
MLVPEGKNTESISTIVGSLHKRFSQCIGILVTLVGECQPSQSKAAELLAGRYYGIKSLKVTKSGVSTFLMGNGLNLPHYHLHHRHDVGINYSRLRTALFLLRKAHSGAHSNSCSNGGDVDTALWRVSNSGPRERPISGRLSAPENTPHLKLANQPL